MASNIFLGKYRVAVDEAGARGETGDSPRSYEGEEIDSGKKVAIEVIPATSLKKEAREQLELAAIAARKLNHPNIQPLYDFGYERDHLVFVRESLEGTSVAEWIKVHGPMPLGPVLRITSQIVSALGAAGSHRVVHRAINPSNIILVPGQTAEGEWPLIKVRHFEGMPKAAKVGGTNGVVDSSTYSSPEQLRYGVVDFRSEIYSLGSTMWFLLTGAPPPMGPEGKLAPEPTTSDPDQPDIPQKIRRLLAKMLSVNPNGRPRDALEFYLQLQECLTGVVPRDVLSRTLGPPPEAAKHREEPSEGRQIPWRPIVVAAAFLAIAVPAAILLPGYFRQRRSSTAAKPTATQAAVPNVIPSPAPASTTGPVVMLAPSASASPQQSPTSALNVTLLSFTPMAGTPGGKDYKIATVTFRIEARSPVTVTEASFYVDSAPFNEGTKREQPITLFVHTGIFLGPPGTKVDPTHPMERTIWLKSQENIFSNWSLAYNQTENATFRWVIGGQPLGGSAIKPLHQAWSTVTPTPTPSPSPRSTPPEVRRAQPAKPE